MVQEAQTAITIRRVERYVGKTLDVLIEEKIQKEELYLGRIYAQAPEVDGLVVIHGEDLAEGEFCSCKIVKTNGIDLEAVPV